MPKSEKQNKKQIKELIELNDELENYFTNTIIPQLFVDADLILRKFTPPAMKQFKFSPEHIGRPIEELVDNIQYSTIIENIREVIDTEQIFEKEIQTTDGCWFQMNILPYIVKKENRINGVIITFVNITGRMNNLRELEKLNASHETFIYSVTHDLLAPLSNIEGLTQTLIEVANDPAEADEQEVVAGMLDKSVRTMRRMINELAEVARAEGNPGKTVVSANFEEVLKEVELTIKEKINESGACIILDIKEPEIGFSHKNLRSIIYNLLSNSIKYRSPDRTPEIHIKTEKEGEFVVISVKDNGRGIPESDKNLVFMQFTRLVDDVEGTGIGLFLLKRIVENEGGKVTIDTKLGEGSEFKVFLKPLE